jgi:hypothetical protein
VNLTQAMGGPPINGDASAVADNQNNVHVFGRSSSGGLLEYLYTAATKTWTARAIGMPPSGIITVTPAAFNDPIRGAAALATTDSGHLVLFYDDGSPPIDLTAQGGGEAGRVYSTVDAVEQNGRVYAYGTNQQGGLIEYQFPVGGGPATFRAVNLPGGRDTMIFQDVSAIVVGSTRQVFGTDGNSRLVHVTIGPNGDSAENVTELAKSSAIGYSPYQIPFAGRIYSDLGVVLDPTNGDLYVYGTNGRDLVEFSKPADGSRWQVTDLTNALPANRVFGAPTAYVTANGDRHILQINEDGEVVEYYKLNGYVVTGSDEMFSIGFGLFSRVS